MLGDHPEWFFKWTSPKNSPYITSICAWTKKDLISRAEKENGKPWKEIYKMGGRAVRVKITEVKK